jgi:hypothetical protein
MADDALRVIEAEERALCISRRDDTVGDKGECVGRPEMQRGFAVNHFARYTQRSPGRACLSHVTSRVSVPR